MLARLRPSLEAARSIPSRSVGATRRTICSEHCPCFMRSALNSASTHWKKAPTPFAGRGRSLRPSSPSRRKKEKARPCLDAAAFHCSSLNFFPDRAVKWDSRAVGSAVKTKGQRGPGPSTVPIVEPDRRTTHTRHTHRLPPEDGAGSTQKAYAPPRPAQAAFSWLCG